MKLVEPVRREDNVFREMDRLILRLSAVNDYALPPDGAGLYEPETALSEWVAHTRFELYHLTKNDLLQLVLYTSINNLRSVVNIMVQHDKLHSAKYGVENRQKFQYEVCQWKKCNYI